MKLTIDGAAADAMLTAFRDALELGEGGRIEIYAGSQPDSVGDKLASGNIRLSSIPVAHPTPRPRERAFKFVCAKGPGEATGIATFGRLFSASRALAQFDVGVLGGDAVMQLQTVQVVAGGEVTLCELFTLTL